MYIGWIGVVGVEHLVSELVSNSIDEFLCGKASEVRVKLHQDIIEVSDDGEGLPFDVPGENGFENEGSSYLTHAHRTPSANNHTPHVHLHGVAGAGLAAVSALSAWLRVRSWRAGKLWEQEFRTGLPIGAVKVIQEGEGRGTTVEFIPDAEILKATHPRAAAVRSRLFEAVHIFPGLVVGFQNEVFHAPSGLSDLAFIQERQSSPEDRRWQGRPAFYCHSRVGEVVLTVAALGETRKQCNWYTWVNGSRTPEDGSHRDGFSDALCDAQWMPSIVMLHAVMLNTRFAGPTKDCLIVPEIRPVIAKGVSDTLKAYCREHRVGTFFDSAYHV